MKDKLTLIIFSDNLDRALAAFNLATGAASMGIDVSMFFTFWGLNILRKKKEISKSKNFIKRIFKKINRGGADRLKLSKFHMFGIGTFLMKNFMKELNIPSIKEMISLAKNLGINIIACNTTMEIMGLKKEDLISEVDEIAGVATYLSKAKDSRINLFI
ncbi:DsrE/DsrF/DrsH-like family protein [SCandidatus Aminicenantes bacterium Aminicenantia_JdfR_composite]|jgi:peroxiredoxin family protein|nr:DsrE/DsrF/DrsH-like family protein [SCandidatus Aminicenantes bacterium Aminicenantia_JdfR_composite]MCP2620806.1 DsrE/DsrF/DrsH-like family protein [Candidatus Aminicenantes bacterium AC-334-E05]